MLLLLCTAACPLNADGQEREIHQLFGEGGGHLDGPSLYVSFFVDDYSFSPLVCLGLGAVAAVVVIVFLVIIVVASYLRCECTV